MVRANAPARVVLSVSTGSNMEKIIKAVEQAKREKNAQQILHGRRQAQPTDAQSRDNIKYSKTRQIDVSPAALTKNRVVFGTGKDPITTAYKMLRTHVLRLLNDSGWTSLAVTSPGPGEGKTLTAVNLAVSIAKEINYTVLLVDLDLTHPSVHRFFDYEPENAIVDYVTSNIALSDILFTPGIERLVVLPGRRAVENTSEMLSSPRMVNLVDELKRRYQRRIVIFDLPPILSTEDALVFSQYVDAALLVVEEGKTRKSDVNRAMEHLQATNVLGTVLNKSAERIAGYY